LASNNKIQTHSLVRTIEALAGLNPAERDALLQLPLTVKAVSSHVDIVREGETPSECCLVLEGFLCRYKLTHDGRRQILSFHIPGDIPDLRSLYLEEMDHSLGTLVRSTVGLIPHHSLLELLHRYPGSAKVFWRDTLVDAAIFREWMSAIGRRSALNRIAHLVCGMLVRTRAVGLANGHTCELPLTQNEIADAVGALGSTPDRALRCCPIVHRRHQCDKLRNLVLGEQVGLQVAIGPAGSRHLAGGSG